MEKLCECGCGQETPIAPQTAKKYGWVKGEPKRFILGHSTKGKAMSQAHKAAISAALTGKPKSDDHVQKVASSQQGKPRPSVQGVNHWKWRGDDVGYAGVHQWIAKVKPKTGICEHCGYVTFLTPGRKGARTEYANLSGDYRRELSDWKELCSVCHKYYDLGGIKGL